MRRWAPIALLTILTLILLTPLATIGEPHFFGGVIQDGESSPIPVPEGWVKGIVLDENNKPIEAAEAQLLPVAGQHGLQHQFLTDFTSAAGQFTISARPGQYMLSIHGTAPPSGDVPFAGVFFPGVDDPAVADRLVVQDKETIDVSPIRLRRVPTAQVIINVRFEDGAQPEWSNVLFHNTWFPEGGLVGGHAPGMSGGRGVFVLPTGYDYEVLATVNCATGTRIETRESRPMQ